MKNLFTKVFASIASFLTFGLSKRYNKESSDTPWNNRSSFPTGKKRGKGYTKSYTYQSNRRARRKPILYGHQVGMPTLRVKCWGMV
jgi:hypothetical protein